MFALFRKELLLFFSSLTGYIVILVFLLVNSLFLWVFPGSMNVLESGYANLDTLFAISPWVFLFLAPAVSMRLLADEKRSGTMESLVVRPITDFQLILAKYLAGFCLMLFALLPSLLFFFSVYQLGNPPGNMDTGATWGSFTGLMFLAAAFVAIGLFSSATTDNQIIAFLVGLIISFLFYFGAGPLSSMGIDPSVDHWILQLGMETHYQSLSRGVIDSRDIVYFLCLIGLFIKLSQIVLQSRKW